MSLDHKKYHKIIKLKAINFKFAFCDKLSQLLDLMLQYKKYNLKALHGVSNAPLFEWLENISPQDLELFIVDVYMVNLMDVFAELCNKLFSGIF